MTSFTRNLFLAPCGQGTLTLCDCDVLRERTGLCDAKAHLLVALLARLRSACRRGYQRLSCDGSTSAFVLHGLAAVLMPDDTFVRLDPRRNTRGVDAEFAPGREAIAGTASLPSEADLPGVFPRPIAAGVASPGETLEGVILSRE